MLSFKAKGGVIGSLPFTVAFILLATFLSAKQLERLRFEKARFNVKAAFIRELAESASEESQKPKSKEKKASRFHTRICAEKLFHEPSHHKRLFFTRLLDHLYQKLLTDKQRALLPELAKELEKSYRQKKPKEIYELEVREELKEIFYIILKGSSIKDKKNPSQGLPLSSILSCKKMGGELFDLEKSSLTFLEAYFDFPELIDKIQKYEKTSSTPYNKNLLLLDAPILAEDLKKDFKWTTSETKK